MHLFLFLLRVQNRTRKDLKMTKAHVSIDIENKVRKAISFVRPSNELLVVRTFVEVVWRLCQPKCLKLFTTNGLSVIWVFRCFVHTYFGYARYAINKSYGDRDRKKNQKKKKTKNEIVK